MVILGRGFFMFLHLGGDVVVPMENVIGIIDVDTIEKSKENKEFFKRAEEKGLVNRIAKENPKSYVITEWVDKKSKGKKKVIKKMIYYSPISSVTLHKRSHFMDHINE